jgi:hypothetical protein
MQALGVILTENFFTTTLKELFTAVILFLYKGTEYFLNG